MDTENVDLWKQKVLAGEALTAEQYRAIVDFVRGPRRAAQEAGARKRAAKGPVKSGDELMAELEALYDEGEKQ